MNLRCVTGYLNKRKVVSVTKKMLFTSLLFCSALLLFCKPVLAVTHYFSGGTQVVAPRQCQVFADSTTLFISYVPATLPIEIYGYNGAEFSFDNIHWTTFAAFFPGEGPYEQKIYYRVQYSATVTTSFSEAWLAAATTGTPDGDIEFDIIAPTGIHPTSITNDGPSACAGGIVNFTTDVVDAASYEWSGPGAFTATGAAFSLSGLSTAMAGIYTLTTTAENGCVATNTTNLVVNTTTDAGIITGTSAICQSATTGLGSTISGGVWTSGNVVVATVGSSGIVTGLAGGTATISYTVTNGCGTATAINNVTVSPLPAAIAGPGNLYTGSVTPLSNSVSGGSWSSSNTSVATIGSSGMVTAISSGTATISYTTACGSVSKILTVAATSCPAWKSVGGAGFTPGMAQVSSIATGPDGRPYVAFADGANGGKASVMKYDGTNWVYVGAPGFSTGYVDGAPIYSIYIAINAAGTVYVAYRDHTAGPVVKKFVSGSWVNVGTPAGAGALALASDGTPYVADWGIVQRFNGTSWDTVGSAGFMIGDHLGGSNVSLTIDTAGRPVVGYLEFMGYEDNPGFESWLRVARYNGTSWTETFTPPDAPYCDGQVSVACNASGTLYVAAALHGYLVTGTNTGSGWSMSYYYSPAGTNIPQLALGTDGVPLAAYFEYYSISGLGASVQRVESSFPVVGVRGISAGQADNVRIAINNAGIPFVSFRDYANGQKLTVMQNTPGMSGISGSFILCPGTTTTLTDAVNHGSWSSASTSVATVGSASGIVTGIAPGTAVITYSAGSCFVTATVTVNAGAGAISGPATVCAGSTATLSNAGSGGTWTSANTGIATVGSATGIVTGIAAGSVTISYTITTVCGTMTVTKNVTVNPLPVAGTITGTGSVCSGAATALTSTGTGGSWSSSNTGIGTVGSSGVVTGIAAGTAAISYTVTNGCGSNSAVSIVTVNASPAAGSISGPATVCSGSVITLTNGISGGSWSSGNTSVAAIGATGIVTGAAVGTSVISYVVTNGCGTATATKTVTVTTTASVSPITGTSSVCAGSATSLSNATGGGSWSSSNDAVATIGTNGSVSGLSAGTTIIDYVVTNTCGTTTVTVQVTVNPLPAAGTITGSLSVCAASSAALGSTFSGGTWTSGNTSVATVGSASGIVNGVAAGAVAISYSITNGCGTATTSSVITVNALPNAGTITGAASVCEGSVITLGNAISGGVWTSASTAIATAGSATGAVTGVAAGTSVISYAVINGCGTAVALRTVSVNPLPYAGSITGAVTVAEGATIALGATVSGGIWSVSNSNASVSSTGVLAGITAGSVLVSYSVTNSCGTAVAINTVDITPFSLGAITGTLTVCPGSTSALSNSISGGTWSSSAPSVANINGSTGIVTGGSAGTTRITYTYSTYTTTAIVTVNPLPAAITGPNSVCMGAMTTLANATTGGNWNSNNTSIATIDGSSALVTGIATGSAVITFTAPSGCYRTLTMTVKSLPAAITGTASLCVGATATYTDATTGGLSWSSSNTSVATIGATSGVLSAITTGTTAVTYTLITGCTTVKVVSVNALPSAITGASAVCAGSATILSDADGGGTWSSSTAAVATVGSTGAVSGIAAGVANITYSLGTGCIRSVAMTVNPLPSIITGPSALCAGNAVTLSDATSGGTWASGSTSVATISASGVVSGLSAGTTIISYATGSGCARPYPITVSGSLSASTGTAVICAGSATTLVNSTTGGSWSSSNATVAPVSAGGVVTGASAGTANITYSLGAGCATITSVTVNSGVPAISGTPSVCIGSTTTLTSTVSGGTWSSSNTALATVGATGIVTGIAVGTPTITYMLASGCYRTQAVSVRSIPAPIGGNAGLCVGSTTILTNTGAGTSWTSSAASVAAIGITSGVVNGIAAGTTTITFTATTGCTATTVVTVDVVPSITAITGPSAVAIGGSMTLSNATAGGIWSSNNIARATVSPAGVVAGISAPAATISYTVANGVCNVSVTKGITVTVARPAALLPLTIENSIAVYPNPTTGMFTVRSAVPGVFTVYTLDGRQVQQYDVAEGANNFSLPNYIAAGVYMCRFSGVDGNSVMVRLVYEP